MKIVMAGSSGFLGTHLRRRLAQDGHEVIRLVRRDPSTLEERRWRPELGELHPATLAGADAVINLAGAGVRDKRWTTTYKALLLDSRVGPTRTIARAIAELPEEQRPKTLLNGSGIHYYGSRGDTVLDEASQPGHGLMPEMCVAWEAASAEAAAVGTRVVHMRTGLVLDRTGGLLKPLMLIFNLLIAGKLGDGRFWMPWISLDDWVSAVVFLLEHDDISGPVNLTGPAPARNVDFTRALAQALHRPAIFPIPKFGVRIVLGELGAYIVDSIRAVPGVLGRSGFQFAHPDLDEALRAALRRDA